MVEKKLFAKTLPVLLGFFVCRIGFWMVGNDGWPDTLSGVRVVFPARRSFWPDDEPHRAQKHSADVYGRHRCRYGDSVAAL